jgi:hypothetical protein
LLPVPATSLFSVAATAYNADILKRGAIFASAEAVTSVASLRDFTSAPAVLVKSTIRFSIL